MMKKNKKAQKIAKNYNKILSNFQREKSSEIVGMSDSEGQKDFKKFF